MEQASTEQANPEGSSRRARERALRRDAMLQAAQQVIAEKGYESATLEEIAHRAEFGKGTLYNYFPGGKEEILLAIFVGVYERMAGLIDQSFSGAVSFRMGLQVFLLETFAFFRTRNDLFVILMREAFRLHAMVSDSLDVIRSHARKSVDRLSVHVQRAMDRGELTGLDAHILAHHILHTTKGIHMQQCGSVSHASEHTPDELAQMVLHLIMDGASTETPSNE